MIRSRLDNPAFAFLLALIPGLVVWLLDKRRQAIVIDITLLVAVLLLIAFPSLPTWYLVSAIYIGQMVYSVGLSVWHLPGKEKPKVNLRAKLPVPLPLDLKQARQMDRKVYYALQRVTRSNGDLITAIVGLDTGSAQYNYFGVTENHLIEARCSPGGNPVNITRYPKAEVAWVCLEIGQRNCLITIRFEEERCPSVTLLIPSKLKKPAITFLEEFPGIWGDDPSNRINSMNRSDEKLKNTLTILICSGFIILPIFLRGQNLIIDVMKILSMSFGIYFLPWPTVIDFLQEIRNDPALTIGRILSLVLNVSFILFTWGISVMFLGMEVVIALQSLR